MKNFEKQKQFQTKGKKNKYEFTKQNGNDGQCKSALKNRRSRLRNAKESFRYSRKSGKK